jgi:O-antigen ligase
MRKFCYILTWIYFFTVPWDHSLVIEGLGPISRVVTIVAIPFVVVAVALRGEVRRMKAVHLAMLVFAGMAASTFYWTLDPDATLSAIRTYMQVMSAVWLAWEFAPDSDSLRRLGVAYMCGAYVSIANTYWDFATAASKLHGTERFNPDGWDQNDLAVALALGILISRYASNGASRPVRLLALAYIPLALVAIALTGSRGGSIVAIAACLAVVYLAEGKIASKVAVAAFLVAGTYLGLAHVPSSTLNRILTAGSDLGTMNDRVSTWRSGAGALPSYLMLGSGAGAFPLASGSGMVAHNTFLSVMLEEGCLGFCAFLVLIILLFNSVQRAAASNRMIWTAVLICWCIGVSSLTWEQTRLTWVIFALAAAQAESSAKTFVLPRLTGNARVQFLEGV